MSSFSIEPINGRDVIQKNFVSLPTKADNYNGRRISLNERFSIIERGYYLQPTDSSKVDCKVQLLAEPAVPNEEELRKEMQQVQQQKAQKEAKKASVDAPSQPDSPVSQKSSTASSTPSSPGTSEA